MRHIIHTLLLALRLVQSAAGSPSQERASISSNKGLQSEQQPWVISDPSELARKQKNFYLKPSKALVA